MSKTRLEERFDAVAMMRRIRAQLNEELEGKSFAEVRERLHSRAASPELDQAAAAPTRRQVQADPNS